MLRRDAVETRPGIETVVDDVAPVALDRDLITSSGHRAGDTVDRIVLGVWST